MTEADLRNLPEGVTSLGLPAAAVEAINRYWQPVWEELELLPERPRRGEELEFEAVRELVPGAAWQARFDAMWPAYRAWYLRDGDAARPSYAVARRKLAEHMPELVAVWEGLVELAGGGD